MNDGFVRVAAAAPDIHLADPVYNADQILCLMGEAARRDVQLLCLPELCLAGYTCGDLFLQDALLRGARQQLQRICEESAAYPLVTLAGLPLAVDGKLYNVAAVLHGGNILGFVPKTHLPNYGEFYEQRHFVPANGTAGRSVPFAGRDVPFGTDLLFRCTEQPLLCLGVEICEDLWAPNPPSVSHALAGATLLANLSAGDETIGKADYRRALVAGQSARLLCGYVYAGAGRGESSTDMVFAGHHLIAENGSVLAQSLPFGAGWAVSEIDLQALAHDRARMNTFAPACGGHRIIPFSLPRRQLALTRRVERAPFVPRTDDARAARCEEILTIQAAGLATRLAHTASPAAVIGISGGLDSCLTLLAVHRAFQRLGKPPEGIIAVTMPCFGTTVRTKANAHRLCAAMGVACREVDITATVRSHLRDIGLPEGDRNVVYENAQARVRTLTLMDLANASGGLVVGTGDLSELALGWATYNGDHMSMYAVNAGVPKTLVRHIVRYAADTCASKALRAVLLDILDTPVSPELLPPHAGEISQKTEELVGPYELHDFFLYHLVRWGRPPALIHRLACTAFAGAYEPAVLLRWLRVFVRRFFAQQFKRSCLPDGPKIGSVTLSPRADWRMPSDAVCAQWLRELEAQEEGQDL